MDDDDLFLKLFGGPQGPGASHVPDPEDEEDLFRKMFGAPPTPPAGPFDPTMAAQSLEESAGGLGQQAPGLGALPALAQGFQERGGAPAQPQVTIGAPSPVTDQVNEPVPVLDAPPAMPGMGDRQMASVLAKRQERVDEITMSYNDHLDSLTEDLFAKGVVNAEGKLHFAAAFAEGMRGSIIPTVYEKAAKFVSGQDPQEGFDSVKRLVEQGVIEPRAGAEMLGAMAAITLDVAATRGLAFSLLPLSAARTAGAAKFGRRVVGAAEGALEGLPADIMRAVTREDEGAGTTAFGTAIGALAGAVLPGPKNVSDEMFERIRTAFRSDNPSEAIASLLREVRPGGFEDTIKRLAPGAPQGQLPSPARVGEPPVGERFAREEAERLRAERGGGGTPGEIKEAVTERIDEVFPSEPAPQPRLPTPEEVGARFEEVMREKPIITPAPKQRKLLARPKSDADFEFGDPEALAPKPNVMAGPALLYETPSGVRLYSSTVAERMNHRHVVEDMFADGIDVNDPGIIDNLSFGYVDHDGKFYFDSDVGDVFDTASSEGMLRKGFMGPKAPEPVGGDVAIDVTERNLARQRAEDAARAAEPLELEHYGARAEDVDFLDPEQMGTGLKGEERKRLVAYPEHAVPRTYFYPAGKRAEPGLRGKPSVRVNVDRSTIATFEQLQESAAAVRAEFPDAAPAEIITRAEKRLAEAGWEGYVGSNGNVAKFTRTQLQPEGTAAARSLLNKVKSTGGFSVDPRTGEDITGGFSVGGSKSFERRVAKTPEEIVQYQAEHADELAREGNFLGGWEQGDDLVLDVSTRAPDEDAAVRLGRQNDQDAVWDLDKGENVWLKDRAGNPLDTPVRGGDEAPAPKVKKTKDMTSEEILRLARETDDVTRRVQSKFGIKPKVGDRRVSGERRQAEGVAPRGDRAGVDSPQVKKSADYNETGDWLVISRQNPNRYTSIFFDQGSYPGARGWYENVEGVREPRRLEALNKAEAIEEVFAPMRERRTTFRRAREISRRAKETARDDLTGVQGRNAFEAARAAVDADPGREWVTFDIRNFKAVNDQGLEAGDAMLKEFADKLRDSGVPFRSIFRRGGDEFAVAVPTGQGSDVAARVQDLFGTRKAGRFDVDARAGVGSTLEQADAATEVAKRAEAGPRRRPKAGDEGEQLDFLRGLADPEAGAIDPMLARMGAKILAGAGIGGTIGGVFGGDLEGKAANERVIAGAIVGATLPLSAKGLMALASGTKLGRKLLTPGGPLAGSVKPFGEDALQDVRRAITRLSGRAAVADRMIAQTAGDLHAATRKLYGGKGRVRGILSRENPFERMPPKVVADVKAYMEGKGGQGSIPTSIFDPVQRMRHAIDQMSDEFISKGIVEGDLAVKFEKQIGMYLTRSYRIFDVPDWAKNAPKHLGEAEWESIVNRFKAWYRTNADDMGISVTDEQLEGVVADFLSRGDDGNPLKYIGSGKLGRLNTRILAKQKDIPLEVRQLWGEHDDPWINFVRTLTRQHEYAANWKFLEELREYGLRDGFIVPKGAGPGKEGLTRVIPKGSAAFRPLGDMRTNDEIFTALQDQFKVQAPGFATKLLLAPNAASKVAKTVFSQVTHVRNLLGNTMFAVANGHILHPVTMAKSGFKSVGDVMRAAGWKNASQADRAWLNKMVELGVIDDNANATELLNALKQLNTQSVAGWLQNGWRNSRTMRAVRTGANAAIGAYRMEDDVWKLVAYQMERARYAKTGLKGEALERTAADIVRNTFPTFSMTPELVNQVRRFGGFISFPSEVYRTAYQTIKQIERELKSPNKAIRAIGAQRAAGAAVAATSVAGVSAAARLLFGITDDDEDAIRTLSPPWSENSTYIHLRAPENGTYQYVDASYFSPYSYITDPLTAMLRGEDWQKALASTATELHKPWTGGSPLFSELLQAAVRSDDVANHENPYWRAVFRSITPGVVDQYARLATGRSMSGRDVDRAHEATALLTGFRGEKKDVREGLRIMSGGFNGRLGQQKGPLRRAKNREGFTGRIGEIRDIIFGEGSAMTALEKKTEESQIDVYAEMMQYVGAAMQIGVTERELRKILRDASISRKNTNIIIRGAYAGVRR